LLDGVANLRIEFHPSAVTEAEGAREWYAERSRSAAKGFLHELDHALVRVAEAPERWPEYEVGTRRLLFRRFPFALIYRVTDDCIQIVAVAHQRRKPGYWYSRT
jgi:plasmid stabilization system protein ParE